MRQGGSSRYGNVASAAILHGRKNQGAPARRADIARAMVTRYGMTEWLGRVVLDRERRSFLATNQPYYGHRERDYSDETAAAVDEEVRRNVDATFDRTVMLLEERRPVLERVAQQLLEKEPLGEEELRMISKGAEISPKNGALW